MSAARRRLRAFPLESLRTPFYGSYMKLRARMVPAVASILAALSFPAVSSAQIDVGLYGLLRTTAFHEDRLVGLIHVPGRPQDSMSYVEEWTLEVGQPLLLPDSVVHIHSAITLAELIGKTPTLEGPAIQETAWSEEESFDISVEFASIVATSASAVAQGFQIGEIIQNTKGEGGDDDLSVGWVLEWTNSDGRPLRQEWWLTDRYSYPSMSDVTATRIRTLDASEYASQGSKQITRRIMVDMSLTNSGVHLPSVGTGCALGDTHSGELAGAVFGLLVLAGVRRRRRANKG